MTFPRGEPAEGVRLGSGDAGKSQGGSEKAGGHD